MSFYLGIIQIISLKTITPMKIPAGRSYTVTLEEIHGLGTTWIVRVHRKRFLRAALVSSDWFLDGDQARKYADQLARELSSNGHAEEVKKRNPGWTLHRPPH